MQMYLQLAARAQINKHIYTSSLHKILFPNSPEFF